MATLRIIIILAITAPSIGMSNLAMAQVDIKQCAAVLVANIEIKNSSASTRLSWLRLIDESNYEQQKQQAGADFSVEGVKVFEGNYQSFAQKRHQVFLRESYKKNEEQAASELRSIVPEVARRAWLECVNKIAANSWGLHIIPVNESPKGATIKVYWRTPPPAQDGKITAQSIVGAFVRGLPEGNWLPPNDVIPSGGSATALLEREQSAEVRGFLTVNGISQHFYIAPHHAPSYVVTANFSGTAQRQRKSLEMEFFRIPHTQCVNTQYWRTEKYCADIGGRINGVVSLGTEPVPDHGLPDFGCFQVIDYNIKRVGPSNCIELNMKYNECSWRISPLVFHHACARGVSGGGTPVDVEFDVTYADTISLETYAATANFTGGNIFSYPVDRLPKDAKAVSYKHSVTIVDISSGESFVLNNAAPAAKGFNMNVADGGAKIIITN